MMPEIAMGFPATCHRGQVDISMTLNRSSHVTPDMQRQAADTLDAVFTQVS
jgi:hypothetical protein